MEALDSFESGPFDEWEKGALRLASTIALTSPYGVVDDTLMAQLQEHFSDAQIIELSMVCGILSGMAKMLFALDVVEKEAYCPFIPPAR